jgi:hypothetical protein
MKNTMIAAVVITAISAGAVAAADLGNGLHWDTEWTTSYDVTNKKLTSDLETGFAYAFNSEWKAYNVFYADVRNRKFAGSDWGVSYTPSALKVLETKAYVNLDRDFKNERFILEAVVKY